MKFKGTGVALVTPFTQGGKVDEKGLRKLVNFQIENGTDFLVVHGSTGEAATLTEKEKRQTLDIVLEENNGKLPIVVGISDNSTQRLIQTIQDFDLTGVDGILSASPHYNKPSQQGIIAHFKAVANATEKDIILYNVPGRTCSNILPETVVELSKVQNIVAVKEASGDINQVMKIINTVPVDFAVLSGEDALTYSFIMLGGHGVISVVNNGLPALFSSMVTEALSGDYKLARKKHFDLLEITDSFFAEGNPSGIKFCLKEIGICGDSVRLPLTGISEKLQKKMKDQLKSLK